jgi:hypothetical protein
MKEDMIALLTKMKEQMRSSLLFLSRLKKISISCIQEDCEVLSDTYAISSNSSSAADCNISSGMTQVFGNPNVRLINHVSEFPK